MCMVDTLRLPHASVYPLGLLPHVYIRKRIIDLLLSPICYRFFFCLSPPYILLSLSLALHQFFLLLIMSFASSFSSPLVPVAPSPAPSQSTEEGILVVLGVHVPHAPHESLICPSQGADQALLHWLHRHLPAAFRVGFHSRISWLTVDYCRLVRLAPGQLDFIA